MNESEIESLADKYQKVTSRGKELPKLDVGTPILYDKNPDSSKNKHPKLAKGVIKNRENPWKYHIIVDKGNRMITRSKHYIKTYMTRSGRISKSPQCLIDQ